MWKSKYRRGRVISCYSSLRRSFVVGWMNGGGWGHFCHNILKFRWVWQKFDRADMMFGVWVVLSSGVYSECECIHTKYNNGRTSIAIYTKNVYTLCYHLSRPYDYDEANVATCVGKYVGRGGLIFSGGVCGVPSYLTHRSLCHSAPKGANLKWMVDDFPS